MKKILIAVVILALGGGLAYRLHANKQKNAQEVAIVAQQEALLVDPCQHDLQIASAVCEEISNDLKALTNAVSELA